MRIIPFALALIAYSTCAFAIDAVEPRVTLRVFDGFAEGITPDNVAEITMNCIFRRSGQRLTAVIRRSSDPIQGFTAELSYRTDQNHLVEFSHQDRITGDLGMAPSEPEWSPDRRSIYPSWDFLINKGKQSFLIRGNIFYAEQGTLERSGNRYLMLTPADLMYQEPSSPGRGDSWRDYDTESGRCAVTIQLESK